jgi:arginine-tRNA-protein transferase
MAITCIGSPSGRNPTSCGYCSPPGKRSANRSSFHAAGLDATLLSCEVGMHEQFGTIYVNFQHHICLKVYQKMIDRGWRRSGECPSRIRETISLTYLSCSGTWCYKPDLRTSCCPQYTIKYQPSTIVSWPGSIKG